MKNLFYIFIGLIISAQFVFGGRQMSHVVQNLGGGAPNVDDTLIGQIIGGDADINETSRVVDGVPEFARATHNANWNINPAAGRISFDSQSNYSGWTGSGISLDTRYALSNYDTFTVMPGNSGLAVGAPVQLELVIDIFASASTEADRFQTGSSVFNYRVDLRDSSRGVFGWDSTELMQFRWEVSSYGWDEQAFVNNNEVLNANGVFPEFGGGVYANNYQFRMVIDTEIGQELEMRLALGDLNPSTYEYETDTYGDGTRQDIGNGQENYDVSSSTTMSWSMDEVAGFEGIEVLSESGFAPIPEPSTTIAFFGALVGAFTLFRRRF